MPAAVASRTDSNVTGASSNSSVPAVGDSTPARIFTSVDLPAPFSPMSACTSPWRTANDTPLRAFVPGYSFVTSSICCQSNVTALTGQYNFNHGILNNGLPTGGFQKFVNMRTDGDPAGMYQFLTTLGTAGAHGGEFVYRSADCISASR